MPVYPPIARSASVGRIAAEYPATVAVFLKHELDFCCGGNRALEQACAEAGLDPDRITDELETVLNADGPAESNWFERPLPELIDHIIVEYHEPLRALLPQLVILAQRVEQAHGPQRGPVLGELRQAVEALRGDLLRHLEDEEQRLFPLIRQGRAGEIPETVEQLVQDHSDVAKVLESFLRMTDGYSLPADACPTWQAYWHYLETLGNELKAHIHLENNVLFPRALEAKTSAV